MNCIATGELGAKLENHTATGESVLGELAHILIIKNIIYYHYYYIRIFVIIGGGGMAGMRQASGDKRGEWGRVVGGQVQGRHWWVQ